MNMRRLINEWIKANDSAIRELSTVDGLIGDGPLYNHLIDHGASPDDAIAAVKAFVDEVFAVQKGRP